MRSSPSPSCPRWSRSGDTGIMRLIQIFFVSLLLLLLLLPLSGPLFTEEYKFDPAETEKKPYHLGGYLEFQPILFGLDKNGAFYKTNFYDRRAGGTIEQYSGALQLEGSLEKGMARLYGKSYTSYTNSYTRETTKNKIFEGYLSVKPSSALILEFGKKTMNWGKGYAWNPVAFLDRPKNPDDPELSREGYIVASADYTRSFEGAIKTFSFTPVLVPVYRGVNDDLGEIDHLNGALKSYLLLYDTDIDLMVAMGGSRSTRYGIDFSRNITTNLEIHGEYAWVNDYVEAWVGRTGKISQTRYSAKNFLLGLRYLTGADTTYIVEFYRNGAGYSVTKLRDFFSFVDQSYETYLSAGNSTQFQKAVALSRGPYGRMNPARNYIYARISQKEPFDILYFTPALTLIGNVDDKSFTLSPEALYTGITNLELRLKAGFISGPKGSDYGERQNDYRLEFRARYYF